MTFNDIKTYHFSIIRQVRNHFKSISFKNKLFVWFLLINITNNHQLLPVRFFTWSSLMGPKTIIGIFLKLQKKLFFWNDFERTINYFSTLYLFKFICHHECHLSCHRSVRCLIWKWPQNDPKIMPKMTFV